MLEGIIECYGICLSWLLYLLFGLKGIIGVAGMADSLTQEF